MDIWQACMLASHMIQFLLLDLRGIVSHIFLRKIGPGRRNISWILSEYREYWTENLVQLYYVYSGGSWIPSKSCNGASYSVQGWSIVSVHTENVSTTKFSNSRWDRTSKRDTPQGLYVQIENDKIWFDLRLSICVLPKVTKTFVHASLFHNMVNIFCPNWQTIVRTNCFGTRVIDRNLALSTVEKEWESLRK
jgi:hypothetical protein